MIRVLVDISYLAYRAMYTTGNLTHEDVPTGILFGVFHQLIDICSNFPIRSNRILIFQDSKTSIRKSTYRLYKKSRTTNRSDDLKMRIRAMRKQMDLMCDEILPSIGFPMYFQEGLESDDTIAMAASRITSNAFLNGKTGKQAVIITSDGDLFQCITPHVHWYDPKRRLYHDPTSFKEAMGVHPFQWGLVKAIAGCSSDNVKGVKGVGEKTAISYINSSLPPARKTYQTITSPYGQSTIKRNTGLVVLPHRKTDLIHLHDPNYDFQAFLEMAEKYGLQSFLTNSSRWKRFFSGRLFSARKRGMIHGKRKRKQEGQRLRKRNSQTLVEVVDIRRTI